MPHPALRQKNNIIDFEKRESSYREIHEKGSGEFVSAVCYIIYSIYLSLCTKQLRRHLPNPFREFPCIASSVHT